MIKNKWILAFLIISFTAKAQFTTVKLNLPSFAFNNFSVLGEYSFNENKSILLGLGVHYPKGTLLGNDDKLALRTNLIGFYLNPEFRFYTGDNAPTGFYIAPYLRFGHFGSSWSGKYDLDSVTTLVDYTIKLNLTEIGGGAQMGYQVVANNGLTFDFMIFGPRLSYFGFKGRVNGILNEEAILDIIGLEGLSKNGFYGLGNWLFEKIGDKATIRVPVVFPAFRAGISIGYTF